MSLQPIDNCRMVFCRQGFVCWNFCECLPNLLDRTGAFDSMSAGFGSERTKMAKNRNWVDRRG